MLQIHAASLQCCSQHLMVGFFFLISSPILDLEHFSQVIYELYYRLCPPAQITPTIRCCSQHLMVGVFFFDLFSYSGLRAFFTSDFTNCTTDYAPPKLTQPSGAVHSIWWLGFFFLISSPILDLEHFSQVILRIVLQIMIPPNYPNHQVLFTASDGWGFFFFWPFLLFWT